MKYVIQAGETLSALAVRFNVPVKELATINHISNPNQIYAGQTIEVPSAWGLIPGRSKIAEWLKKFVG